MDTLTNVWLDCDPGHDDAFAILLMAFSKKINLLGISTVSGNQLIDNMTNNTLKILHSVGFIEPSPTNTSASEQPLEFDLTHSFKHGGLKIPVIEGCAKPFLGNPVTASNIHGNTGLEGDWPIPGNHAIDFVKKVSYQNHFTTQMYRYFKSTKKRITILAIGPLTNIALLLFNHPEIKEFIEKIVFMGGSMGLGNTGPLSEFNIHADPVSASMVCESGLPVYMVPLDCSNEVMFSESTVAQLRAMSTRFSNLFANLLAHLLVTCSSCPFLHDPVAAFFLIEPECFESKLIRVDVECSKTALNYAQTVCDFKGKTDKPRNVNVCYKTNVDKFWKEMYKCIELANQSSPLV